VTPALIHDLAGRLDTAALDIALKSVFKRHISGDWGDMDPQDADQNEKACATGARVVSAYEIVDVKVWVITDAETDGCYNCMLGLPACPVCHGEALPAPLRQVTTILRPCDY
jgi:hypothetical protein